MPGAPARRADRAWIFRKARPRSTNRWTARTFGKKCPADPDNSADFGRNATSHGRQSLQDLTRGAKALQVPDYRTNEKHTSRVIKLWFGLPSPETCRLNQATGPPRLATAFDILKAVAAAGRLPRGSRSVFASQGPRDESRNQASKMLASDIVASGVQAGFSTVKHCRTVPNIACPCSSSAGNQSSKTETSPNGAQLGQSWPDSLRTGLSEIARS